MSGPGAMGDFAGFVGLAMKVFSWSGQAVINWLKSQD